MFLVSVSLIVFSEKSKFDDLSFTFENIVNTGVWLTKLAWSVTKGSRDSFIQVRVFREQWKTTILFGLIKTIKKFSNVISYHWPDLSANRRVQASCLLSVVYFLIYIYACSLVFLVWALWHGLDDSTCVRSLGVAIWPYLHPSISTALMRPRRPKQYCLQLVIYMYVYIYIYIYIYIYM